MVPVVAGNRPEPEVGDGREHFALARDRVRQDDVVGGEPIGRDNEQALVVNGVDIPDLAAVNQLELLQRRRVQAFH